MSITLYQGQEIVGLSLEALLKELTKLRPVFVKEAKKLAAAFVARTATQSFDRVTLGLPGETTIEAAGQRHLLHAVDELNKRQEEVVRTGRRDPAVDFAFNLSVHVVGPRVLAIPFVEHSGIRQLWEKQSWVKPLPYWDNTDPPEELTKQEWRERRSLWSKALNDFGPPVETGYSFQLSPERTHIFLDEKDMKLILAAVPTVPQRAKGLALESLLMKLPPEQMVRPSQMMSLRNSAAFDEEVARLEGLLEPELTGDFLWEVIPVPAQPAVEGEAGKA